MQVKEITISMGRTVNLGDYNTFRCEVSLTATILPDEDEEVEYEVLRKNVYNKLQVQIARVMP